MSLVKELTNGPPTASSNSLHCFFVLESIHIGLLVTAKDWANCWWRNTSGFNFFRVSDEPFCQYTDPCC